MQVILLQDVARVGRKYDIKKVPDGHARNYLIPRKLALPATRQTIEAQEAAQARRSAQHAHAAEQFARFLERVGAQPVVITAAANKQGHLFKGLRAEDIASALSAQSGLMFAASAIELDRPIKEVGERSVVVRVGEQQGRIPLLITAA